MTKKTTLIIIAIALAVAVAASVIIIVAVNAKTKVDVPAPTVTSFVYDGTEKVVLASGDNFTVVGGSATDAGTYTATISLNDKGKFIWADETTDDKTISWTITAQTSAISFEIANKAYDGTALEAPTVTAGCPQSDIIVEWFAGETAVEDEVALTSVPVNAGTYRVRVSVKADSNYTAEAVEKVVTISKAASTLSFSISDKIYDGEAVANPTVTTNRDNADVVITWFNGDTALTSAPVNAGTYKVRASVAENANYTANSLEKTFTIEQKALIVKNLVLDKSYDGTDAVVTSEEYTIEGIISGDELDLTISVVGATYTSVRTGRNIPVDVVLNISGEKSANYTTAATSVGNIAEAFEFAVTTRVSVSGKGVGLLGNIRSGIIYVGDTIELVCGTTKSEYVVTEIEANNNTVSSAKVGDNSVGLLIRGLDINDVDMEKNPTVYSKNAFRTIKYNASVSLLTKEEGGRHVPVFNDFRPDFKNTTLHISTTAYFVIDPEIEMILPGSTEEIVIEFSSPVFVADGTVFEIYEGTKKVGTATIISEIVDE